MINVSSLITGEYLVQLMNGTWPNHVLKKEKEEK